MNKIPSGAKRDLLMLNMAIGLISVSLSGDDVIEKDEYLVRRTNKDYKFKKRIDRRLEEMQERLQETQTQIHRKYGRDGTLGRWVKNKLNSVIVKALNSLSPTTNLELLAYQLLFECFMERDKPLIEEYKWLQDKKVYALYDILIETTAGTVEGETYEDARMIKEMIE